MKTPFILFLLFGILMTSQQKIYSQQKNMRTVIDKSIDKETNAIFDKLVAIRRDLHENPELAGHEINTQKKIKEYLLGLGLEVETDIYGYGIVGILKGDQKGKKIAWRADMDALPNNLQDEVEFKSKIKDVQHGCGHDVHMAIALGIAEVLAKNKNALKGTVYFIFQPEEETFLGAKKMIANELFSKIKPDEIYGLHVTAWPVGQILVKEKEMFAYQKRIQIKLKDELSTEQAKDLSKEIYSVLSRAKAGAKPWEIQNVADPKIGLASPNTIFKDYLIIDDKFDIYTKNKELFLEAYLYETNFANLQNIIPKIKQTVENKFKEQLLSVSFIQENPTVNNDKKLTKIAINTLNSIYGKDFVVQDYGQVPFFNDDFAYFQQKIPGVYFFLGGSNAEKGFVAMNHSPNFRVDEECIKIGVKGFSSLIVERLK